MKDLNFLNQKLSDLNSDFPQIKLKYCYNEVIESYVVEITPKSEFYGNDSLDEAWINLVEEFIKKFPYEDITFVSSDSRLLDEQDVFKIVLPASVVREEDYLFLNDLYIEDTIEYRNFEFVEDWNLIEEDQVFSSILDTDSKVEITSKNILDYAVEIKVKPKTQVMEVTPLAA